MYVETAEDLNRKYKHSFGLYKDQVVFFGGFVKEGSNPMYVYYSVPNKQDIEEEFNPDALEPLVFDSMFINNCKLGERQGRSYRLGAALFRRLSIRQWRRGLSQENVSITNPMQSLYKKLGKNLNNDTWNNTLGFEFITIMRNPTYPTFKEAIDLCDKHIIVAVSPMFAVCESNIDNNKYLLCSKHGFIGECTKDMIWIKHPPSQQEMFDYLRRTHQDIPMEVSPCPDSAQTS